MWWWALTPTADDMSLPDGVTDVAADWCGSSRSLWKLTMLVFVFFLLSGSECCVRTLPTRTWALRWRTYADWSTATWGTCTPLQTTRRWWDKDFVFHRRCGRSIIALLCAVNTNINIALCHDPPNYSLTQHRQSASSWFVGCVNNLSWWGQRSILLLVVLVTVTNVLLKTCPRETGTEGSFCHRVFTHLHLFLFLILENNTKLKSSVSDRTNEIILTCFHP